MIEVYVRPKGAAAAIFDRVIHVGDLARDARPECAHEPRQQTIYRPTSLQSGSALQGRIRPRKIKR